LEVKLNTMTTNKSTTSNLRNNNFCVVIIRDRGNDPALDEMWKGLRSLANAYLYRLRGVKFRRRKRPNEADPSIPPPVAPRVPVPPTAPVRPTAPMQPAPVRPSPPPPSFVEVVKSPPKIGSLHDRRPGPAPIPAVSRPGLAPISMVSHPVVNPTHVGPMSKQEREANRIRIGAPKINFVIYVDKKIPAPRESVVHPNGVCPLCDVKGKTRPGKWLSVDHKDWSPGFLMRPNMFAFGFCDDCWSPLGKLIASGKTSGSVGDMTWSRGVAPENDARWKIS